MHLVHMEYKSNVKNPSTPSSLHNSKQGMHLYQVELKMILHLLNNISMDLILERCVIVFFGAIYCPWDVQSIIFIW